MPLNRAELDSLRQRGHGIARRNKFVSEITLIIQICDRLRNRAPLQFLSVVEFVPARDAAGVEMGDVLHVFPDGADDVALHDLHVIDVVQQFHAR